MDEISKEDRAILEKLRTFPTFTRIIEDRIDSYCRAQMITSRLSIELQVLGILKELSRNIK